jgi:hypothetical protein
MGMRSQRDKWANGQSLIELALLLPVLFFLLAGLVEFGFLFFSYLTALDLTREAARFASARDYQELNPPSVTDPMDACEDAELNFYFDTACFFVDPQINPTLPISPTRFEDVTISVFSVTNGQVTNRWPDDGDGVWSLYNDNWKLDCEGNEIRTQPFFTNADVESKFVIEAPADRGLVLVEVYFCYRQILGLPGLNLIMDDPFSMHTYTFMPSPEAIPTPTPIP